MTHLGPIDRRALLIGLAIVSSFYLFLYFYILMFNFSTIQDLESSLASQVILIEKKIPEPATEHKIKNSKKTEIPMLIEGLYQKSENGNLPIIRKKDNLTSFNAYKSPFDFSKTKNKPLLSIIIKNFGLSKKTSESALDLLPPEVSYSLSPYADMASEWGKILRQSGREFWLNIPFENNKLDSGPLTIYENSSFVKNQKAFHETLISASSYAGISANSHTASKNDNSNQIGKVLNETFSRGLGYLELDPSADASIENIALSNNAPYIKADLELVFLPNVNPFIDLEKILKTNGHAVVVVDNYPQNITKLAEWIIKIAKADYALAPVSAIYDLPIQKTNTATNSLPQTEVNAGTLRNSDLAPPPENLEEH